ncbi:glutamate receptor 2-like [Amphibalanus amphitrite]|uniref:glutamate receptor 2-like n=1 Tax=Amphibalanus amphitrite TaxID=1232801 RepID=UPI001C929A6C|nr:glutamate receptor 2-like [Amphibalanus amphitrite]
MAGLHFVGGNWSTESHDPATEPELRVAAFHDPPFIWINSSHDGAVTYEGYLFDVWKTIAQSLNLRYRLVPMLRGGNFGRLDENGTWTGMVGELVYGRADIALSWLSMRKDRSEVIDFLDAAAVEEGAGAFYVSKNPDDYLSLGVEAFSSLLKPLHVSVWWIVLGAFLLLSLALRFSIRLSRTEDRQTSTEMTWTTCLLSVFGSLVGQGWPSVPSSLSGRVITMLTWLLYIIIVNSYTATMVSYLTVVEFDRPISSLKEFLERPDWKLVVDPGHSVLTDWRKRWIQLSDVCTGTGDVAPSPISLGNSFALLIMIPIAAAASLVILLMECLLFSCSSKRIKQKTG